MAKQKALKILVSGAVRAGDQEDTTHSSLWGILNQVRRSQDPSLDVKLKSQHSGDDATRKSGEAEAILVLVSLATFAARPVLRFIIDLIKVLGVDRTREIGARSRRKLRIKMKTAEIEYEGEDLEELQSLLNHAIEECLKKTSPSSTLPEVQKPDEERLEETSPSSALPEVQKPDIQIIIVDDEDTPK